MKLRANVILTLLLFGCVGKEHNSIDLSSFKKCKLSQITFETFFLGYLPSKILRYKNVWVEPLFVCFFFLSFFFFLGVIETRQHTNYCSRLVTPWITYYSPDMVLEVGVGRLLVVQKHSQWPGVKLLEICCLISAGSNSDACIIKCLRSTRAV